MNKQFYVYIMTNKRHTVLYTGVTGDLQYREMQHKEKVTPGFTEHYNINKLVYYEEYPDAYTAILREKQIKGGSRQKKIDLVNVFNPYWVDLFDKFGL
jgi:putative endonuclease